MALTNLEIKRAKQRENPYRITDGGGLYLLVTLVGCKLWQWKYRFEGKEKLMSFGKYPDVPLGVARQRHADGRRLLASGIDPMAHRKEQKAAKRSAAENSFRSVAARWFSHWSNGKSARHVETTRRRLETNIVPSLGELPTDQIEATQVVAVVRAIEAAVRSISLSEPWRPQAKSSAL